MSPLLDLVLILEIFDQSFVKFVMTVAGVRTLLAPARSKVLVQVR